ncbi:hypothetical protein ARMA_2327 [Ardenticatena maritima]|uniref:Uncharacterized protein n=1 Tax=Ardenticatena maritima TaxID=872965 RepID=A0A0M9UDD4_9CHLR|nr:hypothetical protein ARMA_2327 [Ardenticatena maritima]
MAVCRSLGVWRARRGVMVQLLWFHTEQMFALRKRILQTPGVVNLSARYLHKNFEIWRLWCIVQACVRNPIGGKDDERKIACTP